VAPSRSLEDLRAEARRQGVRPADDDLQQVLAFLEVLLPAFEQLEGIIPSGTPPAGLFAPAEDA
jgi:hypothetical protein